MCEERWAWGVWCGWWAWLTSEDAEEAQRTQRIGCVMGDGKPARVRRPGRVWVEELLEDWNGGIMEGLGVGVGGGHG